MNIKTAKAHNERKVHYKGRTITVVPWVNAFIAQWRATGTRQPLHSVVGATRVQARMKAAREISQEERKAA